MTSIKLKVRKLKIRKPSFTRTHRRQVLLYAAIVLAVLGPVLYLSLKRPEGSEAGWFNDNWAYRQKITIENSGSAISTERKIKFDVDTATLITNGKMQSDCDDVRFTAENGELLDFFIDTDTADCNNASTDFYVRVSEVPADDSGIFLYYGNSSAPSAQESKFFNSDSSLEGLIGYWPMEDNVSGDAQTIEDDALNSYGTTDDAGASGMDCTATGKVGSYGCDLDGSDDHIDIAGSTTDLDGESNLTIMAWAKLEDTNQNWPTILSRQNDGTGEYALYFGQGTDKTPALQLNNSGGWGTSVTAASALSVDTWYHIAATYDGSNAYMYIDGSESDSASDTGSLNDSSDDTKIGATGTVYFDGVLDDVRIYKRTLSESEISGIYNGGSGSTIDIVETFTPASSSTASEETTPGPVGYWKFDEGTDNTCSGGTNDACDSSGQGNDGFITGTVTWANESECISGKCIYVDGSDDYIETVSTNGYNTSEGTAQIWARPTGTGSNSYGQIFMASQSSRAFMARNHSTGELNVWLTGDSPIATGYTLEQGKWYHLTFTYNGADYIVYANGDQVYSGTATSLSSISSCSAFGTFADCSSGYSDSSFKGYLDEAKFYPYQRSAAEIKTDYVNGAASAGSSAVLGSSDASYLSDGLVGYWPMDDNVSGDSQTITDSSGTANNGTTSGASTDCTVAGKFGTGCDLDGDADYINLGTPTELHRGDSSFTASAWVNVDTHTNWGTIMGGYTGSDQNWSLTEHGSSSSGFTFYYRGTSTVQQNSTTSYTEGSWYLVTMVVDRDTDKGYLYVNGELDDNFEGGIDLSGSGFNQTAATINRIGYLTSGWEYLDGTLEDVRLYNRALSTSEVKSLYNWAPGPVAHYKMDDGVSGDAQTIIDSSGNGNNGTTEWGSAGMDCTVSGKLGGACEFDGSDDYINGGADSTLQITGDLTISKWFKADSVSGTPVLIAYSASGETQATNFLYEVYLASSTSIGYLHESGSGSNTLLTASGSTISTGVWYNLQTVRDSNAKTVTFYLNGSQYGSAQSYTDNADGGTSSNLYIGTQQSALYFDGLIDDVRIYNYARTQKQLIQDMNGNPPVGAPAVGSPIGHPVGYWPFDEGYGTTANDKAVSDNDGTISGASWSNAGKYGKALSFDGDNDYIDLGSDSSLDIDDNLTMTAWINIPSSAPVTGMGIVGWGEDTSGERRGLILWNGGSGDNKVYWSGYGASANLAGTTSLSSDTWYHAAVTLDSDDNAKVYLNGRLESSGSMTLSDYTYGNAYIGATLMSGDAFDEHFEGLIDEVKIYNYALTADEILLDMNQSSPIVLGSTSTSSDGNTPDYSGDRSYCVPGDTSTCNAPVAEWLLDEKAGTTANDTSGNGRTGTLANMDSTTDWVKGKYGSALDFDGTNDYVGGPTVSLGNTDLTLSMWVKTDNTTDDMYVFGGWNGPSVQFTISVGTDHKANMYTTAGGVRISSTTSVNDGAWHHIVYLDTGTTMKIYVDGVEEASGSAGSVTYDSIHLSLACAGASNCSTPLAIYEGMLDNVRLYDYARTPAQIAWEYNQGAPVAYYKLDECQGTTAYNSALNADGTAAGNDGTITIGGSGDNTSAGTCNGSSNEAWNAGTTGKYNGSLDFDGTDDYVDLGANTYTNDDIAEGSMSAWVKLSSTSGEQRIVTIEGVARLVYNEDFSNHFQGTIYDGDDSNLDAGFTVSSDTWYHLVMTWDGTNINLYVDGDLKDTNAQGSPIPDSLSRNAHIGTDWNTTYYTNGQIDEVKIYNYPLTAEQVKLDYNHSSGVRFE